MSTPIGTMQAQDQYSAAMMMDPNQAYAQQMAVAQQQQVAQQQAAQQQQQAAQQQQMMAAQQQQQQQQAAMMQQAALQQAQMQQAAQLGQMQQADFMQQLQMQQRAQWAAAMGMHQPAMAQAAAYGGYASKVAMPQEMSEEQPTFVNAKQYRRILKRRQARAKLEQMRKVPSGRKPFLHKSRHEHACRRRRGPSGRFLTKAETEALRKSGDLKD